MIALVVVLILIVAYLVKVYSDQYMSLKVLSFNVLAQVWVDSELRRLVPQKYLNATYRINRQIRVLKIENADIVFLQEVTPRVLKKYMQKLKGYKFCFAPTDWKMYCGRDKGWRTYCTSNKTALTGNAILWKADKFKRVKCTVVTLDNIRSNRAIKVAATLKSGKQIHLVCVHLAYGDRQAASMQFHNIFKSAIKNQRRVIIAGDFNMGVPNMPIVGEIHHRGFTDLSQGVRTHPFYFHENEDFTLTHILTRGFHMKTKPAIAGCKNLFKKPDRDAIFKSLKIFGSDHFPIVTNLTIK